MNHILNFTIDYMSSRFAWSPPSLTPVEASNINSPCAVSTTFGLVVNFSTGSPGLPNAHRGRRMNLNACDGGMNPQINWGRGDSICVESGMDLDFFSRAKLPQKV